MSMGRTARQMGAEDCEGYPVQCPQWVDSVEKRSLALAVAL
jgi:hypothetical protein